MLQHVAEDDHVEVFVIEFVAQIEVLHVPDYDSLTVLFHLPGGFGVNLDPGNLASAFTKDFGHLLGGSRDVKDALTTTDELYYQGEGRVLVFEVYISFVLAGHVSPLGCRITRTPYNIFRLAAPRNLIQCS